MTIHLTMRDDASDDIEMAVDTFDFTLPGEVGGTLGRDLAVRGAMGISHRSNLGKDVNGDDFKPNNPMWAAYKLKEYAVDRPCELGGQMLSLLSCLGTPAVSKDRIDMTYGLGIPPTRTQARNGVPLKPWELKATDRDKAAWAFAAGRKFYEFDEPIAESIIQTCFESLLRHFTAVGLL